MTRWELTSKYGTANVTGAGYLTGIALVCEPAIYLKLAGATVIGYLSFILALQWEGEE